MTRVLHHTLLSARDLLITAGPFIVLALVLLGLAYRLLDPAPPRRVVLATGTEQGAYAEFGKRFAQILKRHGIAVEVRLTEGSSENLALLRNRASGVDVAFVQGGSDTSAPPGDAAPVELVSLGSMFYEPVWLFYREDAARRWLKAPALTSLAQLPGWRVNIGSPGSGVSVVMSRILEANALDASKLTLVRKGPTPAVVDLIDGAIDAMAFVSAPEALMVQMLLRTPGMRLFDFAQAEAYSRRFEFMSPVTLPRGIVDLALDQPPQDVRLVAPTAMLVARADVHPALVQLLVQAAQEIHGAAGWFQHKGDFPNTRNSEIPIASEAERIYRSGVPWLQRYLPFWLANLIDRMLLALISIVAVLIPLARVVPPMYQFRIRSRVFRWYAQLRKVEDAIGKRPAGELLRELDGLEARIGRVNVPLSYADELYTARSHVAMVRQRLLESSPSQGLAA